MAVIYVFDAMTVSPANEVEIIDATGAKFWIKFDHNNGGFTITKTWALITTQPLLSVSPIEPNKIRVK